MYVVRTFKFEVKLILCLQWVTLSFIFRSLFTKMSLSLPNTKTNCHIWTWNSTQLTQVVASVALGKQRKNTWFHFVQNSVNLNICTCLYTHNWFSPNSNSYCSLSLSLFSPNLTCLIAGVSPASNYRENTSWKPYKNRDSNNSLKNHLCTYINTHIKMHVQSTKAQLLSLCGNSIHDVMVGAAFQ